MSEDSVRTRRTELTLSERRFYDLRSIAKPVGKLEESSNLVVEEVCTGLQGPWRLRLKESPHCPQTALWSPCLRQGTSFSRRAMADNAPSPIHG